MRARVEMLESAFLRLEGLQTQTTSAIVSLGRGQAQTNDRLENAIVSLGRETNERLGRIEDTLKVSSRLFELMHERLENLEDGQQELVDGQQTLVVGQHALVERLDRLVDASIRDRTSQVERIAKLEVRVDDLEKR